MNMVPSLAAGQSGGAADAGAGPAFTIPAGWYHDPEIWADPHRFDVARPNAGKHLAFSGGRHFCLGAALARAEGEVGLRQFFTRFPDVELAGPGTRRDTRVLGGWAELPVRLGAPVALPG